MIKRWWGWALAALGAVLALLARGRTPWKKRAETAVQRAEQAGQQAINDRTAAAEREVLDDLAETRGHDSDARLAAALERARRRRAAGG